MKHIALTVLAFALLCSLVQCIKYTDCGSSAHVTGVTVSGCENLDVCPMKRGTQAAITIDFSSTKDSSTLKAVVHGVLAGVPMPFPLPNPDGCTNCGISCPIKTGNSYHYARSIPVRNSYPPIEVKVKWELQDASGADVVCVLIPAKVV